MKVHRVRKTRTDLWEFFWAIGDLEFLFTATTATSEIIFRRKILRCRRRQVLLLVGHYWLPFRSNDFLVIRIDYRCDLLQLRHHHRTVWLHRSWQRIVREVQRSFRSCWSASSILIVIRGQALVSRCLSVVGQPQRHKLTPLSIYQQSKRAGPQSATLIVKVWVQWESCSKRHVYSWLVERTLDARTQSHRQTNVQGHVTSKYPIWNKSAACGEYNNWSNRGAAMMTMIMRHRRSDLSHRQVSFRCTGSSIPIE